MTKEKEIAIGSKVRNIRTKSVRTITDIKKSKSGNTFSWKGATGVGKCTEKTMRAWMAGQE